MHCLEATLSRLTGSRWKLVHFQFIHYLSVRACSDRASREPLMNGHPLLQDYCAFSPACLAPLIQKNLFLCCPPSFTSLSVSGYFPYGLDFCGISIFLPGSHPDKHLHKGAEGYELFTSSHAQLPPL